MRDKAGAWEQRGVSDQAVEWSRGLVGWLGWSQGWTGAIGLSRESGANRTGAWCLGLVAATPVVLVSGPGQRR